jgi:predicted nucleotidyltransferase
MPYGLSDRTMETLTALFKKYSGIREVILYGSRALGTHRNGSDIDITLRTDESFAFTDLLHLMGDFDESPLPYMADISIYQDIENTDLKAHIDRVGKVLYQNPGNNGAGIRGVCLPCSDNGVSPRQNNGTE